MKNFSLRDTTKNVKRKATDEEKIFALHESDERLTCKIHK